MTECVHGVPLYEHCQECGIEVQNQIAHSEDDGQRIRMSKWEPETDPRILRRIGKTGEELSELLRVIQRMIIQGYHGVDPETGLPNEDAMLKEIADVYAQLDETVDTFGLDILAIEERRKLKRGYMREWEAYFDDIK